MNYLEQLRADPRVSSVDDERMGETGPDTDGIWVYLKAGYDSNDDPHCVMTCVHEWSIKDLRKAMRRVTPVSPEKLADIKAHSLTPAETAEINAAIAKLAADLDKTPRP